MRTCVCTYVSGGRFHGYNWACARDCSLVLSLTVSLHLYRLMSLPLYTSLSSTLPAPRIADQSVRPCGRTSESDKRQGRLEPPELQNQVFLENRVDRDTSHTYRSLLMRASVQETTCTRIVKIKNSYSTRLNSRRSRDVRHLRIDEEIVDDEKRRYPSSNYVGVYEKKKT